MLRAKLERPTKPTSARGSVGSARVWDAATRQRRALGTEEGAQVARTIERTSSAEIAALITGIVQVTLETQLAGWDAPRRSALGAELEARLLAVFGLGAVPLAPISIAAPPSAERLDELPPEGTAAETPEPPAEVTRLPESESAEGRALERCLKQRLRHFDSPVLTRLDVARLLARLAEDALALHVAEPSASSEQLDRLDLLQRRAAKLERSLDETRSALAYVSGLEHMDMGIASIYREVQGLSEFDPNHERKRSALAQIFEANLALRKRESN